MVAPNLVGEDGSIDQGQFTQAVQALVKDTGMSESEARQQVFQSTQPTSAQPGPNIPSSVQKDVLNLIPTPEIVEKVYGTDSYEPDGDPILDDPSGTIKWRVPYGRHFHEISNDDMIKREIRITTGLIKEGQSELSDITRQIDGLGDTYPERQRKMELGLEQKSKQESLEALKNRLKAIPSYFGTDQNQQNPISPGGFSPIGSIGLFPK